MMNTMAAALAGALVSGVAMYAVGARAAQHETPVQNPALVQTLDGQYFAPAATQPRATFVSNAPAPAPRIVRTQAPARPVYRTERPAARPASQTVYRDEVYREEPVREERTKTKTALVIGGSAASGAGVGAIVGGKKGALVGAAIGGGAASIYEASKRR